MKTHYLFIWRHNFKALFVQLGNFLLTVLRVLRKNQFFFKWLAYRSPPTPRKKSGPWPRKRSVSPWRVIQLCQLSNMRTSYIPCLQGDDTQSSTSIVQLYPLYPGSHVHLYKPVKSVQFPKKKNRKVHKFTNVLQRFFPCFSLVLSNCLRKGFLWKVLTV